MTGIREGEQTGSTAFLDDDIMTVSTSGESWGSNSSCGEGYGGSADDLRSSRAPKRPSCSPDSSEPPPMPISLDGVFGEGVEAKRCRWGCDAYNTSFDMSDSLMSIDSAPVHSPGLHEESDIDFGSSLSESEDNDVALLEDDPHRDRWFLAFQRILELPAKDRHEPLNRIIEQFLDTAERIGKRVIQEHGMDKEHREIKELNVSGVAGGLKYYAHGIIFKFAVDHKKLYRGEANARKAAAHELRGLNAIHSAGVSVGIGCQLMTIIDFLGFRLSAYSYLPIVSRSDAVRMGSSSFSTLVYGSEDAGRHVYNRDTDMAKRMQHVASVLYLKGHHAGLPGREKQFDGIQFLHGPCDMEGHKINGKYFILDPARLFPPTPLIEPKNGNAIYYRHFRPEFLQLYKTPLSSDALSQFGRRDVEQDKMAILTAYGALHHMILSFASRVDDLQVDDVRLRDAVRRGVKHHNHLISSLHLNGINVRYLKCVVDHTSTSSTRQLIGVHMIARATKTQINELLRFLPKHMAGAELSSSENVTWDKQTRAKVLERAACTTICECFNQLFGDKSDPANTEFWKKIVKEIDVKFPDFWGYRTPPTDDQEIQQRIEEYRGVLEGCEKELFVVLSHMLALTWSEVDVDQQLQSEKPQFDTNFLLEMRCKRREIYAVPRMQADSLALRARRSLDSSEKKNLYENALELYSKALKSKADDQAGLINCGNALADMANLALQKKSFAKAREFLDRAEVVFRRCGQLNPDNFQLLRSWASTLISHARGMMLAATEQARHSQQRLDTAAEMAHRSSSLYLQILKGNLQPATENVNVTIEMTSVLLTHIDIEKKRNSDTGQILNLLQQAERLAKRCIQLDGKSVGALQNLSTVLIENAKTQQGEQRCNTLALAGKTLLRLEETRYGEGAYNLACVYSLLGQSEAARRWLQRAHELGQLTVDYLRHDTDFDGVREESWFGELVAELCCHGSEVAEL